MTITNTAPVDSTSETNKSSLVLTPSLRALAGRSFCEDYLFQGTTAKVLKDLANSSTGVADIHCIDRQQKKRTTKVIVVPEARVGKKASDRKNQRI